MHKNQSSFADFLEQRQPQSGAEDKMQLLQRRALVNLAKYALQTQSKFAAPASSVLVSKSGDNVFNVQRNNTNFKYYATKGDDKAPPKNPGGKQKLLRYPALPLKETIDRWLITCEPLLTSAELEETKKMAHEFLKSDGDELQKLLEKAAGKEENWLADRWLRAAYLRFRSPVTVYSSPGMIFPLLPPFSKIAEYTSHAAKLIYALVKYKELIDTGNIPVVKMGKNELDNSQFTKIYGTVRIPFPVEDKMEYYPDSKHVVVIYNNHFYRLDVYNNNKPLHPKVLAEAMAEIMKKECELGIPFGILTTDTRDNWAESYSKLICISENVPSVCQIQQSLFTVSLDDCVKFDYENEKKVVSQQLIHGGGARRNAGNRWMDKTIQLIVNRNGMTGFTYEHSPSEGQPIALMCDFIYANYTKSEFYDGADKDGSACPTKLPLKSSECVNLYIEAAKRQVNILANNLDINVLHYKNYGKGFLKKQKLSPDSFIQMAIQFAFYKLHKVAGAHYESAHLRIFNGGRTETIRSCSKESIAFACGMLDPNMKAEKKIELLRTAVNGHREYTTLALNGKGVDRHLLGLKLMALENNKPIPKFYESPGFVKSSHFRLSTSQVASALEAFMAYGPITDDGYACCYNPRECDIILAMSAWANNDATSVKDFAAAMKFALDEMWKLLNISAGEPESVKAKL